MEEKSIEEKLYFQDYPVNDYKDDYVGFEEEVRMIEEGIESDSKILGLISEYGSGKSSIIELLKNDLDEEKYDVVNINLLDPNGENEGLEAHKRMLLQLSNHRYSDKKNKKKLSYVTKRLNSNYKSIDISTTNNLSLFFIILSFLFFIIKFLYSNGILSYINFLPSSKYSDLINVIKELCNLSGIIGFIILFITLIKSDLICNYLKNDNIQNLNEFDLMEISKKLISENKITILIIEDLDRLNNPNYIETFIKEVNTYYKSMDNCKFIIALTPEEFYQMSSDKKTTKRADSKYKPFNMVIDLPNIKNSDYGVILNELLLSKKDVFQKYLNIDIEQTLNNWAWISFGTNMNIRRLKHRINSVIHLYKTLSNRFPGKYIDLKTCIAVTYLKDEYENEYEQLINNKGGEFKLKESIEKYIKEDTTNESLSGIESDIYKLTKSGYIDYNCEMYCYNYSKHNKIFDVYEYKLVNALMYDRKLEIDDLKIENIIEKNPKCVKDIINKRLSLNVGLPLNIFESKAIINYFFKNEKEIVEIIYKELLPIDISHIKATANRINKIKGTEFFNEGNLKQYIEYESEQLQESGSIESINQIRLNLLDVINKPLIIKELYCGNYSIITKEEMKKIGDLSVVLELIDYDKINQNNISYIVEMIDELNKGIKGEKIIKIIDSLKPEVIDYYFKNCKSISKIKTSNKDDIFKENKNALNLTSLKEIEKLINNFDYSIEDLELMVIDLLNSEQINISQYKDFVNLLPNVHMCTLKRIEHDDYNFKTTELILNQFEKNKEYYGYVKFKTINDKKIPCNNKKYYTQYEALYSNKNHLFDEYIKTNITFLEYIRDNKIFEKYDNHRFMIMSNCPQTSELLNYAFNKLLDQQMLNDYMANINNIICNQDSMKNIIVQYGSRIKTLNENAFKNFLKCCNGQSLKMKLIWIRRK